MACSSSARRRGRPEPLWHPLRNVLCEGESLILFPEGTRGSERLPGPFKSGLYWLSQEFPDVELIPTYLDNPSRAFPKGTFLPVPISCTVRFGPPVAHHAGEEKEAFLERAPRSGRRTCAGAHRMRPPCP
jgi:1-acyl-sn-glycerol-3-phosphate acyltransferase